MPTVDTLTFVLILSAISLVFLSGLVWCFCCGTCVGRSLLQQTAFWHWARDHRGYHQAPPDEELWAMDNMQDYDD